MVEMDGTMSSVIHGFQGLGTRHSQQIKVNITLNHIDQIVISCINISIAMYRRHI